MLKNRRNLKFADIQEKDSAKVSVDGIDTLTKDTVKEKLALLTLQKQLQLLKLREYLLLISFVVAGALGRVLMQALPSVEPLTFFAMLSGWLFGKRKGFLVGASSLYLSNFFVFGGQGPWTLAQALGFGIAGFAGGFLRKKAKMIECLTITVIATLTFEIILNVSSLVFIPTGIFMAFLLGLPFLLAHVVSNGIFSLLLPKIKSYIEKTGHFNEKDIYLKLMNKLRWRINKKIKNEA